MRIRTLMVLGMVFLLTGSLFAQIPTAEQQIKAAVKAAPKEERDGAKVLGYEEGSDELVTLREGKNEIICLADDPKSEGFQVVCYHESMEPYMARGRELRNQGVDNARQIREEEARKGEIPLPEKAASLYSLNGGPDAYDYANNTIKEAKRLYVLYIPFATTETTGFPTSPPQSGAPWLMREGEPSAHVMMPFSEPIGTEVSDKEEN